MTEIRPSMRIDKWLWAARFFKTRVLATAACDAGHVLANSQTAKPSRLLKAGDQLRVKTEAGDFAIEVLALSEQRGSAVIAAELYRESDESRQERARAADLRRALYIAEPNFARKPSKKDRRLIHSFRGRD